jgi:3-oxoadipate enol-lactonase
MPLNHRISGADGAPKLLLGGSLGTSLRIWDGQSQLAERFQLVRFDHRGHGDSPVPAGPYEIHDLGRDVLALMDELRLERASYCGLSIGGMVGMWLGINAPERIDRLVLVCTSAHMPPASAWQQRARTVIDAGSTEPIADQVVERWLTPAFAAARPDVRADLRAMLTSTPADGYARCCGAIARMDLRPRLEAIAAPTLVVSGSEDGATPLRMQAEIAAGIPGARHEVVTPAAHVATVERPEQINRLIEEHLS